MASSNLRAPYQHDTVASSSLRAPYQYGTPHVTYLAFGGNDQFVAQEVGRSAFSVSRSTVGASFTVLVDAESSRERLLQVGLPASAQIQLVHRAAVSQRFQDVGLMKGAHHSGWGGYAKLLIPELLPTTIEATIIMDSDTINARDLGAMWALRTQLDERGSVLAAKRLQTGGACLHGERINSGVVLMDLRRARQMNWTRSFVLDRIAHLGRARLPARECGKMIRNGTMMAGDQELLSYACLKSRACLALPAVMHQDKCDGWSHSNSALIYHFNCHGRPESDCPTTACTRLAREWGRLYSKGHLVGY